MVSLLMKGSQKKKVKIYDLKKCLFKGNSKITIDLTCMTLMSWDFIWSIERKFKDFNKTVNESKRART